MGPKKVYKQSYCGAVSALLQSTNITPTSDSLQVQPNKTGTDLWNWVQPSMGAGGHILGLSTPSFSDRSESDVVTKAVALRQGSEVLAGLNNGEEYQGNTPNHALGVLLVLAENARESRAANEVMQGMPNMWVHARRPPVYYEVEAMAAYETKVLAKDAVRATAGAILKAMDCTEPVGIVGRRWVKDKIDELGLPSATNKACRFIGRLVTRMWSRFQRQHRILTLVQEIRAPLRTKRKMSVEEFVMRCWSMRASSISCKLPKTPPESVRRLLAQTQERNFECVETMTADLLGAIRNRIGSYKEWCALTNKDCPKQWSDNLSSLARAINPSIKLYNSMCYEEAWLARASAYVPKDLAPEMYSFDDFHKLESTSYFFFNQGMYYCYSPAWREDAYKAVVDGRYKTKLVSRDEAIAAGNGQMPTAKADVLRHITYLQEYYFKGGFMTVNSHVLRICEN
ncbi:hypothetical protein SARC_03188 [Sphaeroforma arctica JP610]|uniref:Uncharacterized protein n=1 Tax=Sphaeroforma arctica JP610 TaxID=667725 RepID=A0A0L0G6V6_9EUKA|nr:hypothetical protein SARC_03188 [Sphaeroforma arctica JP610]KNC84591.1 hypothetical protein SARC_03188 [Sphaeroforma arctica JP610]|eukprot:XP_014158493.1 hypothetical protein SARC_03188 [Sphaeroforma arctica JP610]